jgi:hypothetical protein
MKFFELKVGQKFMFEGKIRNKMFKVVSETGKGTIIENLATKEQVEIKCHNKKFHFDVELMDSGKTIVLEEGEVKHLTEILHEAYKVSAEKGEPEEVRSSINKLYKKIKG